MNLKYHIQNQLKKNKRLEKGLHVVKLNKMSIDVLLSSDYNYTGNLPGKFINYLSNKIETDKKLKVCLKNISFCNSYDIKLCDIKIEYNITNNDFKNTFTSKNKTKIYDNTNYFFNYLYNNYKNSYININSSTLIILKEILEKFTENNNSILNDIQNKTTITIMNLRYLSIIL